MKTYYLYHLIDPNTNIVRYVGISYHPKQRYNEHINGSKKLKTHKDKWIESLIKKNQKPLIKIIYESSNKKLILEYEIKSITSIQNLTNSTSGGEYFSFTPEIIIKLSEKNKGSNNPNYGKKWSLKAKQKLSLSHQGEIRTPEWRKNIGLGAKHRKEIIINSIKYSSIKEAMRVLHIGFKKAQSFVIN